MPTDSWRLAALEDGSSSSSDPEEALSHIVGFQPQLPENVR